MNVYIYIYFGNYEKITNEFPLWDQVFYYSLMNDFKPNCISMSVENILTPKYLIFQFSRAGVGALKAENIYLVWKHLSV